LGNRYERWLSLQKQTAEQEIELSAEQVAFIEKHNLCFKERHVESSRSGKPLNQDTFFVGHPKGVGKVYLHVVLDTYSTYAFGFLHVSKQLEAAVAVLYNEALPFHPEKGSQSAEPPYRQRQELLWSIRLSPLPSRRRTARGT